MSKLTPTMREGVPLNHIDSSHQTVDHERHVEESPVPSPSHSSTTLPVDMEKGGLGAPRQETSPSPIVPAAERSWKDDVVTFDSKVDVSPLH